MGVEIEERNAVERRSGRRRGGGGGERREGRRDR